MQWEKTFRYVALGSIFLVPLLPLVVSNSLFFPFITGKNFLFRILVEIGFASWLLLAVADVKYRPRFSWILGAFLWFVAIIFVADIFGVSPHKSLWSNYERMEGFVTLSHLLLYFIVLSSVLESEKLWNTFWKVSIAVATLVALYAFGQIAGTFIINQGDVRVDGRIGNAAYLAIYMLFHVYIALMLAAKERLRLMRVIYLTLAAAFAFVLIQTGTRGTILALGGSAVLAAAYIALFERENPYLRKIAIAAVAVVIAGSGIFFMAKDAAFVRESPILSRVASISFSQATTRLTIWGMALEGVKERPILGWGQENFNYVFNKYYRAELYAQEPWFDRTHNAVFDWLIAGGILGFLSYVFLILSGFYYALGKPFVAPMSREFSVVERGLILGVLSGYVAHNLLVFDNLVSYALFVGILAMMHTRVSRDTAPLWSGSVALSIQKQIVFPTALIVALAVVYAVNVPGLLAARDIIFGFNPALSPDQRLEFFERALSRGSFADQEIREQLTRFSQSLLSDPNLATEVGAAHPDLPQADAVARAGELRTRAAERTESELKKQLEETPDDARVLMFLAGFLRSVGQAQEAIGMLDRAHTLSPEKQQIQFELALAYLQSGDIEKAKQTMSSAFALAPENVDARIFYAIVAVYTNDTALLKELITPEYEQAYVTSDAIINTLYTRKMYPELIDALRKRVGFAPKDINTRVTLAAVENESGDTAGAIRTIEEVIAMFPDFKTQGSEIIRQLKSGVGAPAP